MRSPTTIEPQRRSPLSPDALEALLHRYGEHLTVDIEGQRFQIETRDVLRHATRGDEQDLARLSVMIAFCRSLIADGLVEAFHLPPPPPRRLFTGRGGVRCIDCRHHRRTADHPHLVDCAAGVEPTNPTRLFWDTDRRGCDRYEPLLMEPTP